MSVNLSNPYIEFCDVEVRYTHLVQGLRRVTFSVNKGEFVFLVGKTGAGKSTVLKVLTREVSLTKGRVTFDGRNVGNIRPNDVPYLRREMGIVPQDCALLPRKRVWENVAYAMRAVGHSKKEVRQKVPEILERVNIGHRADAFPHELSGGEQQRVAIGRALINDPPLLLADEPTGHLDPQHSWDIMHLLKTLNDRGTTVLVASHDMMVVERMGNRVITLEDGRISTDTPGTETLKEPSFFDIDVNWMSNVNDAEESEKPVGENPADEDEEPSDYPGSELGAEDAGQA